MSRPLEHLFKASNSQPAAPKTLVLGVYQRLRAAIICGELKPGTRLRAEHLKVAYQVSGATMREALALLVADALVVSREQRGFIVAPVSIEDFADITEIRAMMESHAVRLAIRNGDDDWEAELTGAFHRLSLAEDRRGMASEDPEYWEECNKRFHEVLVAPCQSRWLRHFLRILYHQSERYRRIARFHAPPDRDVHQEHGAIYEFALRRDEDQTAALLEQHIRTTLDVFSSLEVTLKAAATD